jgi:urease accessory protein
MTELSAILQLADATFPSGAFAHSFGLETAIAEERVRDAATLQQWLTTYLRSVMAPLDGAAFVLLTRDRVNAAAVDARLAVAQTSSEIRLANAHLARATLDAYAAMTLTSPRLEHYAADVAAERCAGQHVIAVALGYEAAGVPWRDGLLAHATTTATSLASVAARTIPLGQRTIVFVRWALREALEGAVARAEDVDGLDELASGSPALELDTLRHRTLDGRLFAS